MAARFAVWSAISVWALVIALSIPLLRGRIRPNGFYGFRTSKTLSDPAIWYAANRFAGQVFVRIGVLSLFLSLALLALLEGGAVKPPFAAATAVALELVPLIAGVVLSLRHLKDL